MIGISSVGARPKPHARADKRRLPRAAARDRTPHRANRGRQRRSSARRIRRLQRSHRRESCPAPLERDSSATPTRFASRRARPTRAEAVVPAPVSRAAAARRRSQSAPTSCPLQEPRDAQSGDRCRAESRCNPRVARCRSPGQEPDARAMLDRGGRQRSREIGGDDEAVRWHEQRPGDFRCELRLCVPRAFRVQQLAIDSSSAERGRRARFNSSSDSSAVATCSEPVPAVSNADS